MKNEYYIVVFNFMLALIVTLVLTTFVFYELGKESFILFFGAVCVVAAVSDLAIAGILFFLKKKIWGKGFLLSAGMFALIGLGVCGPMFIRSY